MFWRHGWWLGESEEFQDRGKGGLVDRATNHVISFGTFSPSPLTCEGWIDQWPIIWSSCLHNEDSKTQVRALFRGASSPLTTRGTWEWHGYPLRSPYTVLCISYLAVHLYALCYSLQAMLLSSVHHSTKLIKPKEGCPMNSKFWLEAQIIAWGLKVSHEVWGGTDRLWTEPFESTAIFHAYETRTIGYSDGVWESAK